MKKLTSNFALHYSFLACLVFTRSFAGIYIFNYRIGEYLVALGLILTIFLTLYFKLSFEFDKFTLNIFRAIFLAFLVTIFATNSDLLWTYTFRVTSYIWTASYVFVGYYLFKDFFTKTNSYILFLEF